MLYSRTGVVEETVSLVEMTCEGIHELMRVKGFDKNAEVGEEGEEEGGVSDPTPSSTNEEL